MTTKNILNQALKDFWEYENLDPAQLITVDTVYKPTTEVIVVELDTSNFQGDFSETNYIWYLEEYLQGHEDFEDSVIHIEITSSGTCLIILID